MNAELLFPTVNSVNQISVYAAITDWCYEIAWTNEEKEHVAILVDNRIQALVDPEKVDMLMSSPNQAQGNLVQGSASFRRLGKKVQMTHMCDKAPFQHLVTAGNRYQV